MPHTPHQPHKKRPEQGVIARMEKERAGKGKSFEEKRASIKHPKEFEKFARRIEEANKIKIDLSLPRNEVYKLFMHYGATLEEIIKMEMSFVELTHQGKPKPTIRRHAIDALKAMGLIDKKAQIV